MTARPRPTRRGPTWGLSVPPALTSNRTHVDYTQGQARAAGDVRQGWSDATSFSLWSKGTRVTSLAFLSARHQVTSMCGLSFSIASCDVVASCDVLTSALRGALAIFPVRTCSTRHALSLACDSRARRISDYAVRHQEFHASIASCATAPPWSLASTRS